MAMLFIKLTIFVIMTGCFLVQLWTGEALSEGGLVKRSNRPGQYWLSMFIQGGGVLLSAMMMITWG